MDRRAHTARALIVGGLACVMILGSVASSGVSVEVRLGLRHRTIDVSISGGLFSGQRRFSEERTDGRCESAPWVSVRVDCPLVNFKLKSLTCYEKRT